MGRSRYRYDVLIALATAGCSGVDDEPTPQWMPVEPLGPELVQLTSPMKPVIRVVTYNTYNGADLATVGEHLLLHPELVHADVIALQETVWPSGDPESDVAPFAAALGMGHVFVPLEQSPDGVHGLSFVSRFPLRDIEVMMFADYTGKDFLESDASRAAISATIDTSLGPIRIVNVHLAVVTNIPERILQVRPAVLHPELPTVVMGDFNTNDYLWALETVPLTPLDATASTSQARALDSYMRAIGYATPTAGFGCTWQGYPECLRLDSVFTHGLASGAGGVDREIEYSDHWPLFLDVGR
jgi:endonuclease/exonuclease/phosphatase family metal-dependent hydrolase